MRRGLPVKNVLALLAFVIMAAAAACGGNSYHSQYIDAPAIASGQRHVAVLPLVNLTPHPNAGRAVGDMLATEMYGLPGFSFMERTAMQEGIKGPDEDLEYVMDNAVARKLGEKLGVDTVVYGSVTEYGYKRGIDQSPAVGVNLRLLDVKTGAVLWAASMSGNGGCFWVCDDSLNRLTQEVVGRMVRSMAEALP